MLVSTGEYPQRDADEPREDAREEAREDTRDEPADDAGALEPADVRVRLEVPPEQLSGGSSQAPHSHISPAMPSPSASH